MSLDGKSFPAAQFIVQEPGAPQLPYECYRIILPYGHAVSEVNVVLESYTRVDGNFDIDCTQPISPISKPTVTVPRNESIYGNDRQYPYVGHELIGIERLSGVDIAIINVYPYRYNPMTGELGYFRDLTVEVTTEFSPAVRSAQSAMISRSGSVITRLERLAVNPSVVNTYPEQNRVTSGRDLVDPGDPATFLIVAGEAYLTTFNDYATWKETHGVATAVYTIEDVLAEYTAGADDAANLRDFIIDAYQTWASSDSPLEYVLLAGDDEIIPIRGCWGNTDYYPPDYNIPCDLYYGCLDGDWNANGNSYYGESDDDPDLFAEVHVGRFPGDNLQDFQNMIYKIMQYVDDPWDDVYTALMVGELLQTDPLYWGGDFLDLICDDTTYMPEQYTVTKMYDRDGTFSTSAVTNHVNANQSALIYHCAHTHYYYLLGWSQYDIDNLQNTEYPFFSAGGCYTLAFDQATSGNAEAVGEHAMFAEGGMMAFLGNSRIGYSNWTNYIQQLMYGVFTEGLETIGASLTYSRDNLAQYIDDSPSGRIWRWEYYELILAGDPQIYLVSECIDSDNDLVCDNDDNCVDVSNPLQEDVDDDTVGDSCDNCIHVFNPDQTDTDGDMIGDACDYICGDADASGEVDIDDVVYLIAYIFAGGPEPAPYESGDANCSGAVDIDDAVYLINYIFAGGNSPCDPDGDEVSDC
jgi:hypothetical protein